MQSISSNHFVRLLLVSAFVGCGLLACGGEQQQVDQLRRLADWGQLEKAEAGLAELHSPAAESLRAEIGERQAARLALDGALAGLTDVSAREACERLKQWLANETDPVSVERIEMQLSAAVDRAATEAASAGVAKRGQKHSARVSPAASGLPSSTVPKRAPSLRPSATKVSATKMSPQSDLDEPARAAEPVAKRDPQESDPALELDPEVPSSAADTMLVRPIDVFAKQLEAAERKLTRANASGRQAAYADFEVYAELADPFIARALHARWEKTTTRALKNPSLRALAKLAQDRVELDSRRALALELIFDEETYFYPYRPPECPPQKASGYRAVQLRVDRLVGDVRESWDGSRKVKLAGSFHDLMSELDWLRERAREQSIALILPEHLPARLLDIRPATQTLDIRSFAWDLDETRRLYRDQSVAAYNQKLWSKDRQGGLRKQEHAERSEQQQVQITNAYRRMFGRRALAWNPLLQAAADWHTDYMARSGDFGHYEPDDPAHRSPFDRMGNVGYNLGTGENCALGAGSPQGAQDGWARSSGHHRNLLMQTHTEMGAAVGGAYWTQDFGTDKDFENELDSWQD